MWEEGSGDDVLTVVLSSVEAKTCQIWGLSEPHHKHVETSLIAATLHAIE